MADEPTKIYSDFQSFREANLIMTEFQVLRNILRRDYELLLEMSEQKQHNQLEFNSMYRSCLVQLFTMIEADIYGIEKLDPYPPSKNNFYSKFTNTFIQASKTWNKQKIWDEYFTIFFPGLMAIKQERNYLIHPSKIDKLIIPHLNDLERLRRAFNNYCTFINNFMNGFYIGINNPDPLQLLQLKEEMKNRGVTLKTIELRNTIGENK